MSTKHTIKTKEGTAQVNLTPLRAIHYCCVECCSYNCHAVRKCETLTCALYPYRMGNNPSLKGKRKNNLPQGCRTQKNTVKTPSRMRPFTASNRRLGVRRRILATKQ